MASNDNEPQPEFTFSVTVTSYRPGYRIKGSYGNDDQYIDSRSSKILEFELGDSNLSTGFNQLIRLLELSAQMKMTHKPVDE